MTGDDSREAGTLVGCHKQYLLVHSATITMLIASMIRLAYVDLVSYLSRPYNRADSYKRQ
jgi:hypothetical protein